MLCSKVCGRQDLFFFFYKYHMFTKAIFIWLNNNNNNNNNNNQSAASRFLLLLLPDQFEPEKVLLLLLGQSAAHFFVKLTSLKSQHLTYVYWFSTSSGCIVASLFYIKRNKEMVHPKIKTLTSFTHPCCSKPVWLTSAEHKIRYDRICN